MIKLIFTTIALIFSIGAPSAAVDFTGYYDLNNWTQSLEGGSIDLSGAPLTVMEISSNGGGGESLTTLTIAADGDHTISFDWVYTTEDQDGSTWDPFGYILNGLFTQLTVDGSFESQSGTALFLVQAGDIFGFAARSVDSALGSSTTTISKFSATPIPAAVWLMGSGLLGLMGFSRKNKAKALSA